MDYEIKKIKSNIKNRKEVKNVKEKSNLFYFFSKLFIVVVLTLSIMIFCKQNNSFKKKVYEVIYEKNISFATINKYYNKYFGSQIPFKNLFEKNIETVFNESLEYSSSSIYKDGVSLTVTKNYMVPIISNGIVVFIGEKEGYGNTVIIEGEDGVDIWYSNIENISVNMYDYVESKSYLGNTIDDKLYLVFKKDGKNLDYKKYI